ncbi:MAG: bifunctional metallophosphatase/5'-nucleotidase [Muribaculaceae bacterium]|nr:bifunctional metallophosphatase/5'-nucleotidase [Muribaculaceae bacterium]
MKITEILLSVAIGACVCACSTSQPAAEKLVILHSNDTHSHIDPLTDSGLGGVARRKVLIDSVRQAEPNVLLVDAGDIVQGTLYFHLYRGAVEQQMLNELGYDYQILGNHEFDNGTEGLKAMLANAAPTLLSSNYSFSDPELAARFKTYDVKEFGGKRIGLFALNLNPKGMIAEGNYDGVEFLPWKEAAEKAIRSLREDEKCDYVIALTHVGVNGSQENPELFGDVQVAQQTSGIDLIIGGHSHTRLEPSLKEVNAAGDTVIIVQTGKYGQALGEITIDLESGKISDRLIAVDSRLDSRRDPELLAKIEPSRAGIDSLYNREVATLQSDSPLTGKTPELQAFTARFIADRGKRLAGKPIDVAIGNKGSLRTTWNPGAISEGAVLDMMPFRNRLVILDLKGSDLLEAFKVMDARGGDIAGGLTDPARIDPEKHYRVATIDYLANGGDYMTPLTRGTRLAESRKWVFEELLDYLSENPVIVIK